MKGERLERATRPGSLRASGTSERCWIGVPGLDALLPEGVRYGSQIMCTGETGVGKTVLAAQFLYEGLLVGDACVYVACDEAPENMRIAMASLRIGTLAYERAGRLLFIDAYARERSSERVTIPSPGDLDEFFSYERQSLLGLGDERPIRLVVDSMSTIFASADHRAVLEFNRDRLRFLSGRRVLALDNFVVGLLDDRTVAGLSHAYPVIIKLGFRETDGDLQRYCQLGKLRSGMFTGERRFFRIDPRAGIVVQR